MAVEIFFESFVEYIDECKTAGPNAVTTNSCVLASSCVLSVSLSDNSKMKHFDAHDIYTGGPGKWSEHLPATGFRLNSNGTKIMYTRWKDSATQPTDSDRLLSDSNKNISSCSISANPCYSPSSFSIAFGGFLINAKTVYAAPR